MACVTFALLSQVEIGLKEARWSLGGGRGGEEEVFAVWTVDGKTRY